MLGTLVLLALAAAMAEAAPSVMHPAFKGAGQAAGLQIWRIVSFEPQPINSKEHGKFYEGDSYIVLQTKENKAKKGTFSWDIYFWLGSKTSQDESGAAAILSVELDDSLGGGPVQHREVQGHESPEFQSLFKPAGVRYLSGGAASGFHHVEINAAGEKKLYQVKGKKYVRVKQVAPEAKSMNKGDCFILDTGRDIYVWVGSKAKGQERVKSISAANLIRDQDHAGRAKVSIIDASSSEVEVQKFFSDLGSGTASQVANEPSVDDDLDFEKKQDASVALYKISDASGKLVSEKISEKPLVQSLLKTDDCFILDTVTSGIYIWVGKKSTVQEKVKALEQGQSFITANKYPPWTKLQRVVENAEPAGFREYFTEWRTGSSSRGSSPQRRTRSVKEARQCGLSTGFMPDSGEGNIEVWRVENLKLAPLPTQDHGIFFNGDSYVIKYTFDGGRKHIIYFWQGQNSTNDERGVSALEAVRMDNELGGHAIQIRVEQGSEPAHFLKIFRGNLIILNGGHKSGFRNIQDATAADTTGIRLFRILGSCDEDVRAIQVTHETRSLDTNDAFLLETPAKAYLWLGKGCTSKEAEFGRRVAGRLCSGKALEEIKEGSESQEFWSSLGGKGTYNIVNEQASEASFDPRLFHGYIRQGHRFIVEEIPDFNQEDLFTDDVMILDNGDTIFLWLGKDSSLEEKHNGQQLVEAYIRKQARKRNYTVITLKQGAETEQFKSIFDNWNDSYWQSLPSLDDLRSEINEIEDT